MKVLSIYDFNPLIFAYIPYLSPLAPDGNVRLGLEKTYSQIFYRLAMEYITRTHPDATESHYIVANDADSYFRKAILPEYKAKRSPKPSCYYFCQSIVKDIPHLTVPQFEADDIIAYVVAKSKNQYDLVRIYTCDGDIFQLVQDGVEVVQYVPHNPEKAIYDVAGVDHWFNKRVIRRGTRQKDGVKSKYWRKPQVKPENKFHVPGNPHASICALKFGKGDESDNYKKNAPRVIYDLTLSPIHSMNIGLPIQKTSDELNQYWLESLSKTIKQLGRIRPDHYRQPFMPVNDPTQTSPLESMFGWT